MGNSEFGSISFDLPKNQSNVIKVIGVGGGGSNAINHMFKQGIKGVDFFVCNTDAQALDNSAVPNKIQLGIHLTEGLGAGANPEVGQQSAIESISDIEKMLDTNTKMVFITAGMGGGTGTGAAPIIAQLAKDRDILTVGIVTLPFSYEGKVRQEQALLGIEKLRKQVDSLIVINNNKLREVYGNLGYTAGFSKADEVLATASRGIAEVITHHYTQNIDLRDAKTVLANSGTAIMGSAIATGEFRAKEAIKTALDSPLLNDNKITGAKNVLLLIVSGSNEITLDEIGEINDYIQSEAGFNANIIMGVGQDNSLEDGVAVTVIATGFNVEQQNEIVNTEPKKIIHTLEEGQKSVHNLTPTPVAAFNAQTATTKVVEFEMIEKFENEIAAPIFENELIEINDYIKNMEVSFEIISPNKTNTIAQNQAQENTLFTQNFQATTESALTFDLPLSKPAAISAENENTLFELTDEVKQLHVTEPVQFVPVTEHTDNGVVRYSLEAYMEAENELIAAKPASKIPTETIPEELQLTMTRVESQQPQSLQNTEVSPTEMTIEETLRLRAEERRIKLKEFNYKFNTNAKIDAYEKQPAYQRQGIDLQSVNTNNAASRTTVSTDSNNDLQLRSNNSYLHDNVD